MRTKIRTLGLICLFVFSFCTKYVENPYTPPLPEAEPPPLTYMDFEFEATMTVALAEGTSFLIDGAYCTFYFIHAGFEMGGVSLTNAAPYGSLSFTRKIRLISTFQEEFMHVDYLLFMWSTLIEEGWLENAQFTCTLKLVPITEGFAFSPDEQQMTVTGWAGGEVKSIYFTLTKE